MTLLAPGELVRFLVSSLTFLLLSGPQVQLDICWLWPKYESHYCTLGDMLIVLVVHRCYSWVGLLEDCILPFL